MNIELRISQLERRLTDVSTRRARVRTAAPVKPGRETAVAGWNRLERVFRGVLNSLKLQRDAAEIGMQERGA